MTILKACLLILPSVLCTASSALAQQCPKESKDGPSVPSEVRTLEGKLVFHDGVRKWFELKLDQPQCGQNSIELVPGNSPRLQVLRNCRVISKGQIDFSPTGYYSLKTYQEPYEVEPVGVCDRQPLFPDYSKAKPGKSIRQYRVDMDIIYDGEHPIIFRVTSAGKELQPWQAYASYLLTGGFVLYGHCGEGFVVDKVFGTQEANPSHLFEPRTEHDAATFDPEGVTESGKKEMHLGYTCIRTRSKQ